MYRSYGGLGGTEILVVIVIVLIIALAVAIPYLLTLQRALEVTSPEVRSMSPGQVWLLLIPLFNLFWLFNVVRAIADAFEGEYRKRGIQLPDPRPTYNIGMAYASLNVSGTVLSYIPVIKILGSVLGLASFVLWIIYWVKVAEHKNALKNSLPFYMPQQPYNNQQQYYNQQQNPVQQYYNQQQPNYGQQNTPPQPPPQNNPNQWAPPQNPPADNTNPWAPPPPPAQ